MNALVLTRPTETEHSDGDANRCDRRRVQPAFGYGHNTVVGVKDRSQVFVDVEAEHGTSAPCTDEDAQESVMDISAEIEQSGVEDPR